MGKSTLNYVFIIINAGKYHNSVCVNITNSNYSNYSAYKSARLKHFHFLFCMLRCMGGFLSWAIYYADYSDGHMFLAKLHGYSQLFTLVYTVYYNHAVYMWPYEVIVNHLG